MPDYSVWKAKVWKTILHHQLLHGEIHAEKQLFLRYFITNFYVYIWQFHGYESGTFCLESAAKLVIFSHFL